MASKGSVLVTGANGGLGSAIVSRILNTPDLASSYTGLYTVRRAATAAQLQFTLARAPADHKHETVEMDLGSLASVRKAATEINSRVAEGKLPKIRALILNAGYQDHSGFAMSEDGFEMTWHVNFLSNMLLSLLLLQSMDEENGRILIVGSWTHDIEDKRNDSIGAYGDPRYPTLFPGADDLARGRWSRPEEDPSHKSGMRRYGASKLCAVMFAHELADRLSRDPKLSNISVIGLDPGGMGTDISRRGSFLVGFVTMQLIVPVLSQIMAYVSPNGMIRPPWKTAADIIRACFEIEAHRGELLHLNGTAELATAKEVRDEEKRKALWGYGLQAAKIAEGDAVLADWN